MSDYGKSVARHSVQILWGAVAVWLVHHSVPVSNNISNWVVDAGVAAVMLIVMTAIRWLESRPGDKTMNVWARALGRLLMLGIDYSPTYPPPTPPAPTPAPPATV
jgi:short subunit dehydrogenase-like uncharacterized protein